ncbi:MAG: hypothetical protein ABWX94_00905 [Candidatus Saccharimonadales bacterium]
MYSFNTHQESGLSQMSYSRLIERPSGLVIPEALGTTTARVVVRENSTSLELPDSETGGVALFDAYTGQVGVIVWTPASEISGEPALEYSNTSVTVPDLSTLVDKAASVWRTLVGNDEVHVLKTDLKEIRETQEHITPSGLIVHSEEHPPVEAFVRFAASADEISAIEQITASVLQSQTEQRPGGYL